MQRRGKATEVRRSLKPQTKKERYHVYSLVKSLGNVEPVEPAVKHTMVEVEAICTVGNTCVGALVEVETSPACGALVTAATNTGLTQRGALLTALLIITEKATGALRHTHPGERVD